MRKWLIFILLTLPFISNAQNIILKPGFNPAEYLDMLDLTAKHRHNDSVAQNEVVADFGRYKHEYRSEELGLKNCWDLWLRDDNVAVISIRGTTASPVSWLENFYAAMVPATGSLQLNDSTTFSYQLAKNTNAAVHVGWLLGVAHISPEIVEKIKDYYTNKNLREIIIIGHSQGAALAFLLRSYLYYLGEKGTLPNDLLYKTYCSAAPKPGNLYYAYDYEFITRDGWGITVVNTADWVPESPFSVQTLSDFNELNPFVNINDALQKQNFLVRWYLKNNFNKMSRRARKAQKCFENYLGDKLYPQIRKILPQFRQPEYAPTANYMRAGTSIVLMADEDYYKQYPNDPKKIFTHHFFGAYKTLLKKYYLQ